MIARAIKTIRHSLYTSSVLLFALIPFTDDIAHYIQITGDQTIESGHLISFLENRYALSAKEYDNSLVGVVNKNPAAAINTVGHSSTYPTVKTGNAAVLVNSSNGPIETGDPITSSSQPGVAMKATRAGFIVGRALEPYNSDDKSAVKAINTMLLFQWADIQNTLSPDRPLTKQLFDRIGQGFRLSTIAALEEPSTALRYTLAILVLLLSFVFGFLTFGRVATNGVYAIGRNPLARRSIGLAIAINVLITVAITASGLVVAVMILTF